MQLTVSDPSIWIADMPVDFRKSIDGLCEVVHGQFDRKPDEAIFVFYNRNRDKLKILAWHNNGFVLLYKRLERGKFTANTNSENGLTKLNDRELSWLLAGLDWVQMSHWKELEFDDYF